MTAKTKAEISRGLVTTTRSVETKYKTSLINKPYKNGDLGLRLNQNEKLIYVMICNQILTNYDREIVVRRHKDTT